jgi:hypothetical protein
MELIDVIGTAQLLDLLERLMHEQQALSVP